MSNSSQSLNKPQETMLPDTCQLLEYSSYVLEEHSDFTGQKILCLNQKISGWKKK